MLRVALKKTRKKKVKKFAFDHCKTCSERFVIRRDNFSFIFQRKEDKEMSEKRCYTVQELQEILGVSRPTIYNLLKKKEFRGSSWMAESIASQRRVSMTGSITWNSKKQGVDQADFVCIDILNFYLDLRYDIRKNTNTKKTGSEE